MTAKQFFNLVSQMREAQRSYFETREQHTLRLCRYLENEVDREIRRVHEILGEEP